jgi:hypothetical protein
MRSIRSLATIEATRQIFTICMAAGVTTPSSTIQQLLTLKNDKLSLSEFHYLAEP